MIRKFSLFSLSCIMLLATNSFGAGAANLSGIKGTLKNIEKPIKSAVSKVEELFEQNAGAAITAVNLLGSSNPFLTTLTIYPDYSIRIKLAGNYGSQFSENVGSSASVPVAQVLMGARIKLIPVFEAGDSAINSWECVTDADKRAVTFLGSDATVSLGSISFISTNGNSGGNDFLSNCTYVADSDVW